MDLTIITTYRCNSRCSMCHAWQNPSLPEEEISLATLDKLPDGVDHLNLTGGEPTLRSDLLEIVELLHPKARKLEISSNGLHPRRLEPVVRKFPDVKIRFSLEGLAEVNDRLRGEVKGFETKLQGLRRLKELGGCDLGFATTIQDDNAAQLVEIYRLARGMGVELATSALHNGYQFHKNDNYPYDRLAVAREIEKLIAEMLSTNSVKDWFRAYLNLGLVEKTLGRERLIPCTAATDFAILDPWGQVFGCNVRPDLKMGSLGEQSWDEIFKGKQAEATRRLVKDCRQNCWMVASARTAMRNPRFTRLPKFKPLWWVLRQKSRLALGLGVSFERDGDLRAAGRFEPGERRLSYLSTPPTRRKIQRKADVHYFPFGPFDNR